MVYYVAQFLGVLALCIAVLSFQKNTQKQIVTLQMLSSSLFTVHFFLLEAYAGAFLNFVAILRACVFRNKGEKWAENKWWLVLFCLLSIAAGMIGWTGYLSILPILGMLLTTLGFWIENPRYVRFVSLPSSPCWFIYNLFNRSYPGMLTELFVFSSIVLAICRFDLFPFLKRNKKA